MASDFDLTSALEAYRSYAQSLLSLLEQLSQAQGGDRPLDEIPGWRELKGRPILAPGRSQSRPWVVATLFGPTGAGKSTLFRELTGLNVPAGDVIRPVTFNALVAVPNSAQDEELLKSLFPFYRVRRLEEFEQLKERGQERDVLYYAPYYKPPQGRPLDLILADVPDFDTIYRTNWEKAADMMRRAEIVIFAVYPSAYMDAAVLDNLAKCCAHAGKLAVLLTKTDRPEQAQAIWKDLIEKARTAPELAQFRETHRQDGTSLAEFLAGSSAYYSLRAEEPRLDGIRGIGKGAPEFYSLLTGVDAAETLIASLREDTSTALESCKGLIREVEASRADLSRRITIAEEKIEHAASIVAGTCFPAGKMTSLILETTREYRPVWVKVMGTPLDYASRAFTRSKEALQSVVRSKLKPLRDLEKERISEVLDDLLTALRAELPEAAISMEEARRARERWDGSALPQPSSSWEESVRQSAREWAKKNPWKTKVLGSVNDLLVLVGGAAVGLDLLVTGGQSTLWGSVILGKLGLVGAAGAGGAAAGALLNFYERLGLRGALEVADQAWRRQRTTEIAGYLRKTIAEPLFLSEWDAELAKRMAAPVERAEKVCAQLCQLLEGKWRPEEERS